MSEDKTIRPSVRPSVEEGCSQHGTRVTFILMVLSPLTPFPGRTTLLIVLCFLSIMSFSHTLPAAEWSLQPSLSLKAEYNDNIRLTTGPHDSVTGRTVSPQINFGRATETSQVNLRMLLNFTSYSGDEVNDLDEQILVLSSRFRTTERTTWRLDGRYRRDNLFRTIDIDSEEETGEGDDTDIGLVDVKVRRNRLTLRPSWTHQLTERSSLRLGYRLTDVSYSEAAGTGLVDYERHLVESIFSHKITVKDDFTVTGSVSRYRAPDTDTETDNTQILVGIRHAFSETAQGRLSAGFRETVETRGTADDRSSGVVWEAGLRQRSELTTLDGVFRRSVSPSGAGSSVESNQLRVKLRRKVSPKLSFLLRAKFFRNKALEGSTTGVNRRYYVIEPGLRWRWTREWFIYGSYRYRRQKYDDQAEAAKSNAVLLGVAYRWPKLGVSR